MMNRALGLALVGLAACSKGVCDPYGGRTCIELEVHGAAGVMVSSLHIVATQGFTLDATDSPPAGGFVALPVSLAVVPPDEFGGDFTLEVTGLLTSVPIDRATIASTVAPRAHTHLTVALGDIDDHADMADMAPEGDMAREVQLDTECGNDVWSADMKGATNCAARHAAPLLEPSTGNLTIFEADQVHIARDPSSGRLGVVTNANGADGFDETGLIVATFDDTWPVAPVQSGYGGELLGERQGTAPSIVMSSNIARICFLDTSDAGNALRYTEVDSTGNFGMPTDVLGGLGSYGFVASTFLPTGELLCAYYNPQQNGVFYDLRTNGTWGASPKSVVPDTDASSGLGSIALSNVNGGIALAHQQVIGANTTMPVLARFQSVGSGWSPPKTLDLDQGSPNGIRGADVHIAQFGGTTAVSYIDPGTSGTSTLRIATTGVSNTDPVYVEPPASIYQNVVTVHAIAYDSFGYLHVALISPAVAPATTGTLYYLRQYPNGGSAVKWLVDVIDNNAGDGGTTSSIDFVMDPNDRPHIVYFSGDRGRVMYATRTDR